MTQKSTDEGDPQAAQQHISLEKIYLKDLSFESPRSIGELGALTSQPEVKLDLDTEINQLEGDAYEVFLRFTIAVTTQDDEKTLYLIEAKQGGLFVITGFPEAQLDALLHVYCPNMLFPYAREVVSGVVERGGFPQLLLKSINFEAIYERYLEQRSVNVSDAKNLSAAK